MKTKLWTLCLLLVAWCGAAQNKGVTRDANWYFDQGNGYYRVEAWDDAIACFSKANELFGGNQPDCQFNIGQCYKNKKNYAAAYTWYRKAAEQGNANAQCVLGFYYAQGRGVAQDDAQAVYWFCKAAEQGYADAQCGLGACYATGRGVARDDAQAVYWFRKAAEQGHVTAQSGLGDGYAKGLGVAQDDVQAMYWYRKAAEQGDVYAQYSLGVGYADGQGVSKDLDRAVYWLQKAAEQGHEKAGEILPWVRALLALAQRP